MFPKIVVPPNHQFWGTLFLETPIYCSNVWPNHEVLWASGQCLDLDGYFAGHLWAFFGSKLAVYGLPAGFGKTNLLFDGVGSKNEPIFSTKKCHERVNPAHNVNQCFFSISLFRLGFSKLFYPR